MKTFRPRLLWVGLGVLAVVSGTFFTLFFAFRGSVPVSGRSLLYWPDSLVYGLDDVAGFFPATSYGTCLVIVVVGAGLAREYSWRTLQLWLGQGVSRPGLLAAKLLVAVGPAILAVLTCLAAIGALSLAFSRYDHGSIDWGRLDGAQLALAVGRTVLATLPYAALAALLAVASRSTAVAVGGSLAFLTVGETSLALFLPRLGGAFAHAAWYLPSGLAQALSAGNPALAHAAMAHAAYQPSAWVAAAGVAVYTLVLGGLAALRLSRQDLGA